MKDSNVTSLQKAIETKYKNEDDASELLQWLYSV